MVVSAVQPSKSFCPRTSTFPSKTTVRRELQPLKASAVMDVTEAGMKISSIELFINALVLIEVILSGMLRFFSVEFANAYLPMVFTAGFFGITLVLQENTIALTSFFIRQLPSLR